MNSVVQLYIENSIAQVARSNRTYSQELLASNIVLIVTNWSLLFPAIILASLLPLMQSVLDERGKNCLKKYHGIGATIRVG